MSDDNKDVLYVKELIANKIDGDADGTQLGSTSSSLIGFWGSTPINQEQVAGDAATFVAGSGTGVNEDSTFDSYTISRLVRALRATGIID